MKMSKSSNENNLHQLSYVGRIDLWIPDKLNEKKLVNHICVSTCFARRSLHNCDVTQGRFHSYIHPVIYVHRFVALAVIEFNKE